jgi:TupA-like ATPgrasp
VRRYRDTFGHAPNVIWPRTFNEKIQRRILFDRNPRLAEFSDKLRARAFVRSRMGDDELLPQLYAVVESPAEIRQLHLPARFVMKANHASGWLKIVDDASAVPPGELESLASTWLGRNFYDVLQEWGYRDVKPRIMFEELLEVSGEIPSDYKFFCFDGEPRFLYVSKGRFRTLMINYYDANMTRLPITRPDCGNFPDDAGPPPSFGRMLEIARRLSKGIDHVRVDLYDLDGQVRFGELSSYSANGRMPIPHTWDLTFGGYWK